ncbi:MAG: hypothetical protein QOI82_1550 [Actinomycetota bacterium]|jgi:hypothetical protein|nr:hypothetical protein [Actinomycetota bacterium]
MYVSGIYRQKNAVRFAAFLRQQAGRADVALWGLDGEHPDLATVTVGTGPGKKFELLNRILDGKPPKPGHDIVVTDDDVTLSPGGLRALLALGHRAGFGLFQPAHGRHSTASHAITRRRHGALARETTFVEIGPVFVVAPSATQLLLPFPADAGMGWGLELQWRALRDRGLRMGIVDAVRVNHPDTPGSTYDDGVEAREKARERALLDELGLAKIAEAQQLIGTWWPWQPKPPWRHAHPAP